MIKILHIADLHLGLEFSRYPSIAAQLKEERLRALKVFVDHASATHTHFIVVAGDLFDKLTVSNKLIKQTTALLSSFNGEVIIIPGNHDWYNRSAGDNKVWNLFLESAGSNIHFLNEWKTYSFDITDRRIIFYPCGCHQKHSDTNLIGWVKDEKKEKEHIHIGIAHGNVEGYGLDEEGNYFSMNAAELKDAGVDVWLMGHIHAPHPRTENAEQEVFFFAGNHCSDSWKAERSGGAWMIAISDDKKIQATRWHHEGICFKDRTFNIHNTTDAASVIRELKTMKAEHTILRISLNGSLTEEELEEVKRDIETVTQTFLYTESYWNISLKLTSDKIDQLFSRDSIPHILLSELSKKAEDKLAMQLAYETIKSLAQ